MKRVFMQKKNLFKSTIIIILFFIALYGEKTLKNTVEFSITSSVGKILYFYSWWIIPVALSLGFLFGFKNIFKELRIHRGFLTGLGFAFVTVWPMIISSAFIGKIDRNLTLINLLHYTVIGGFMEEILFRGFLFGTLFRKLKWGFIPASMLGAIFFGIGHLYQSNNITESFGVFFVTFTGALWFAWLFIEWEENLWVPIFLHVFMNLSWTAFNVGGNAAGSSIPNIFRIITIVLTIVITVVYNKRKKLPRRINKNNLLSQIS